MTDPWGTPVVTSLQVDCKPLTAVLYDNHTTNFSNIFCKIIVVAIIIAFNKQPPSVNSGQPLLILMTKITICHYFLLLVTPRKNHSYTVTDWTVIYSLLCIRSIHESFFAHWYIFCQKLSQFKSFLHSLPFKFSVIACCSLRLCLLDWPSGSNGSTEMGNTVKVKVS